jgi:hypothetical protein
MANRVGIAEPVFGPDPLARPILQLVTTGLTRRSMLTCGPHGLPDQARQ